jgi:hypothetical protein
MDRRGKSASDAATALVVRQFSPSRIERQLLTQVFECVVATRRDAHEVVGNGVDDPETNEVSRLAETTSSREATRSAA